MKLLFENWRGYLNEETEGEGMLLYHATCSPPESFTKGIDPTRAKGYGQGEGFYFFTKKENAINHGRNIENPKSSISKEVECPPEPQPPKAIIVISDEPVTPENFDIDYELFGYGFSQFILQNLDYFSENDQALGLGRRAGRGVQNTSHPRGPMIFPNKKLLGTGIAPNIPLPIEKSYYNPTQGEILSIIAKKLNQLNPEMFKKFEEQFLSKANAIKYNGKEKIIPLRIEDIEGNVIWSR